MTDPLETIERKHQGRFASPERTQNLVEIIDALGELRDTDTLLERVLQEGRRFVHADAGTLYLRRGDELYFAFVQNDTLFPENHSRFLIAFPHNNIPIDRNSVAGYCASSGETLLIDDVYDIQSSLRYSFNREIDAKTNYRTRSILAVPLLTREHKVVGVLQLINAKDETDRVIPFSMDDLIYIKQFARNAANALEQTLVYREMILRMVRMSELKDPSETVEHARRIAGYSAELYQLWADKNGVPEKEARRTKEMIRYGAMLHDVGKVGVDSSILKNPGQLTLVEKIRTYAHTVTGAALFDNIVSHWDEVCRDIILNHHERWNGKGYPGKIGETPRVLTQLGPGKQGEEIPLSARIVALADVYDALITERVYKPAWTEDQAFAYIKTQSGKHFDPELATLFVQMGPVIRKVREEVDDEEGA